MGLRDLGKSDGDRLVKLDLTVKSTEKGSDWR